ncbi:MAG: diaminopimelate epimerase [Bacillota bacterium]
MNGCGNDFIVIDNRDNKLEGFNLPEFVKRVCQRRVCVGADGLLLLENSSIAHFKMRYFNSDGSEGEMCGNGARCLCRFAYLIGAAPEQMSFETAAGVHHARVQGSQVRLELPNVSLSQFALGCDCVVCGQSRKVHCSVVGVPHAVVLETNVMAKAPDRVRQEARAIASRREMFPQGTNVNFVEVRDRHNLIVRTYERGVEDETLACGTGSTAAAIVAALLGLAEAPVAVRTRGGVLRVNFDITGSWVANVTLEGEARVVATGHIVQEGWEDAGLSGRTLS